MNICNDLSTFKGSYPKPERTAPKTKKPLPKQSDKRKRGTREYDFVFWCERGKEK